MKGGWTLLLGLLLGLGSFLMAAIAHAPAPGTLDDAFVVLVEARGAPDSAIGHPDLHGRSGMKAPERVESATSLLDVWVRTAAMGIAPAADPLRVAGWIGLGWMVALVGLTAVIALRWSSSWAAAAVMGSAMAVVPGLVESAGYLLEGPLFALLWAGCWMAAIGQRRALTLGLGLLLAACRPEGMALAPLVSAWAFRAESSSGGLSWPALARGAAFGLGPACLLTGYRQLRFGVPFPNTFYAKASDSRWIEVQDGMRYVTDAFTGFEGVALAVMAVLCIVVGCLRRRSSCVAALLVGSLACIAILVVSGGDSYSGRRLFVPVGVPLVLGLSLTWGVTRGLERLGVALGGLLALALLSAPFARGSDQRPAFDGALRGWLRGWEALRSGPVGMEAFAGDAEVFASVRAALGPGEPFAHLHVQRYRWFEPGAPVLDMTGLTDPNVARLPAPDQVLFGRAAIDHAVALRVGAIHLDPMRARPSSWVDAPDLKSALSDSQVAVRFLGEPFLDAGLAARISAEYLPASRVLPGGGGVFNLAVRADLADRFSDRGFRVGER